jgi:hypothetical protein
VFMYFVLAGMSFLPLLWIISFAAITKKMAATFVDT